MTRLLPLPFQTTRPSPPRSQNRSRQDWRLPCGVWLLLTVATSIGFVPETGAQSEPAEPPIPSLEVCATTPTLGSLARTIGGNYANVTTLAKPGANPYRVRSDASFRECMAVADVYIRNGAGLEDSWTFSRGGPPRSRKVIPGGAGFVDASYAVEIREVPGSGKPSVAGSLHAKGNPHYLLDPLNALLVARLLEARFASLRPRAAADFARNRETFESRLGVAMVGAKLSSDYHIKSLALLFERGELRQLLESQGRAEELSGWFGALLDWEGSKLVLDSRIWSYFTQRFNLRTQGVLEPIVGQDPPPHHVREMAESARDREISVLLASVFAKPTIVGEYIQYAGGRVASLEHLTGRSLATDDYIDMMSANVARLVEALASTQPGLD